VVAGRVVQRALNTNEYRANINGRTSEWSLRARGRLKRVVARASLTVDNYLSYIADNQGSSLHFFRSRKILIFFCISCLPEKKLRKKISHHSCINKKTSLISKSHNTQRRRMDYVDGPSEDNILKELKIKTRQIRINGLNNNSFF